MIDLIKSFTLFLNRNGHRNVPVTDDIYRYLNFAQDKYIENLILTYDNNIVNNDHLLPLIVQNKNLTKISTQNSYNNYKYDSYLLPNDYKHHLRYKGVVNNIVKKGTLVDIKNLDITLSNPFSRSTCYNLLFSFTDNNINVYYKDFVVDSVMLDYVKTPNHINNITSTYIEDNLDIIELAVNMYLQNTSNVAKLNTTTNIQHNLNYK